jgi:hypothetical protein
MQSIRLSPRVIIISDRSKIIGQIFVRNEYSARAAKNKKKSNLVTFNFLTKYFRESEDLADFFCQCFLQCKFLLLSINLDHVQLSEACNCSPRTLCFEFVPLICNVSFLVPNIRYRPKQKNPFSADRYAEYASPHALL